MASTTQALFVVMGMALVAPAPAWAFGGAAGCADLPDYARATGVLEGIPRGCDMSVEEANRIVRAHDGYAPAQPAARSRHRRHRRHY